MLEKEALIGLAKLNHIKPHQQEKHYIQALILDSIADQPLVFKGGTYLWFFHSLPRFSEDLDFTASEEISNKLPQTVSGSLKRFGVENKAKVFSDDPRSFSFRISAQGPLMIHEKEICHVYVELSRREKLLRKPTAVRLDFPPYQLVTKVIQGMNLDEVAAEKVRALLTRSKPRDLYDLAFLVKHRNASFDKELVVEKLKYYGLKYSAEKLSKAVDLKGKTFKRELKPLVFGELPPFKECAETVKAWVDASDK